MKNKYWTQKIYCIVCPDSTAYDYVFSKIEADKTVKKLNKDYEFEKAGKKGLNH
jgi:hypothetical protein